MAEVWKLFDKEPNETARCKKCLQTLSCKGSSTSGMLRHMKNKHGVEFKPTASNDPANDKSSNLPGPMKQQSSMLKYVKRQSLSEIVARLAAVDGFSINAITKSDFIRQSITARGFSLPKSRTTVMKLICQYYDCDKIQTKNEIVSRINKGELISLTLDEWTSACNKRYINVNIHFGDGSFYNLGFLLKRWWKKSQIWFSSSVLKMSMS